MDGWMDTFYIIFYLFFILFFGLLRRRRINLILIFDFDLRVWYTYIRNMKWQGNRYIYYLASIKFPVFYCYYGVFAANINIKINNT
ncbi:hypothetical protein BZA77DRAFT_300837, partial [Pyronema omphalodes]